MNAVRALGLDGELRRRLDRAVAEPDTSARAHAVSDVLADAVAGGELELPTCCRRTTDSGYARRLIHRDPDRGYSVVAMTWDAGQATPVHDHNGLWCVEVVVAGAIQVQRFELIEEAEGRVRLQAGPVMDTGVGDAGRLIPPSEYHLIRNPSDDAIAITLHVYGGDMERCCTYVPEPGAKGWYRPEPHDLELLSEP